ncbi:MAG TPA: DUF4832 domain-containing protein, partial [Aggregatilineales bacterium]|nr:DUF4832 domain-containing protein [Aggregatilineales bacterium]
NIGEDAQPYVHCDNALQELAYLRYSVLNQGYHEDVLALWQEEGCYDEIAMRLGYRLRMIETQIPTQIGAGEQLTMTIKLQNDGFGGIYNPRGFEIILRSTIDGTLYRFPMENSHDPRQWLPNLGEITLPITIDLPADLPSTDYEVLVNLPDPSPALYGIPEYSIRLANEGVWESDRGFNNLQVTITVN